MLNIFSKVKVLLHLLIFWHFVANIIVGFLRQLIYSVQLLYNGGLRNPTIIFSGILLPILLWDSSDQYSRGVDHYIVVAIRSQEKIWFDRALRVLSHLLIFQHIIANIIVGFLRPPLRVVETYIIVV